MQLISSLQAVVIFILISTAILSRILHLRYFDPLRKFNGPLLASFTDLWRYLHTRSHRSEVQAIALHAKYGEVVRVGPSKLSFANPQALKEIYGVNKGFRKSQFYWVAAAVSKGVAVPSLFSNLDEAFHAKLRRSVNNAFALSTLVQYEPFVDKTIELFLQQLDDRFAGKSGAEGVIDWPTWLQYYAFDVIGELTYSSTHGFLETGKDVDGIIAYIGKYMRYVMNTGQMPILDKVFWKNPFFMWISRHGLYDDTFPAVPFARKAMEQKLAYRTDKKDAKYRPEDLLTKFLQAKEAHPDVVGDKEVMAMALSMVFAGSETTAITLSSIFYYLLKNPRCLQTLLQELDTDLPTPQRNVRHQVVSFSAAQKLPYLDACIKEAFRIHPAPAFDLERVVPKGGGVICGEHIPECTIVSCNAWVIHRNKQIFGDDVDMYRPERWLEDPERTKVMAATLFHFGMGSRTCIGKNISLLEMYKAVPSILKTFEISLADGSENWVLWNDCFVKPTNFDVRIQLRKNHAALSGR